MIPGTPESAHDLAQALERPLQAVEQQLAALTVALRDQDIDGVDTAACGLQQALTVAVEHFSRAARHGGVPASLRHRLAIASGQVAAQREALARATASLDRAIDVLLPRHSGSAALYSAAGGADRRGSSGSLLA